MTQEGKNVTRLFERMTEDDLLDSLERIIGLDIPTATRRVFEDDCPFDGFVFIGLVRNDGDDTGEHAEIHHFALNRQFIDLREFLRQVDLSVYCIKHDLYEGRGGAYRERYVGDDPEGA